VSAGVGEARVLQVLVCDKYQVREMLEIPLELPGNGPVQLKVDWGGGKVQFFYAITGGDWQKAGPCLDGSILSDDYVQDADQRYRAAFTGAFVGVCCQDLSGHGGMATFSNWKYEEVAPRP
jgi:xylan 1,4-beta-xylosidase